MIDEIQDFERVISEMVELKKKKSSDYRNSWRIFGFTGIVYQIASKFVRLWNLKDRIGTEANEPIRDTLKDMANYCIMGVQILDRGQTKDIFEAFNEEISKELNNK